MIAQFDSKKHLDPLEQIIMKSAIQNRIPLNNLPRGLQMNAKHCYLKTNKEATQKRNLKQSNIAIKSIGSS